MPTNTFAVGSSVCHVPLKSWGIRKESPVLHIRRQPAGREGVARANRLVDSDPGRSARDDVVSDVLSGQYVTILDD